MILVVLILVIVALVFTLYFTMTNSHNQTCENGYLISTGVGNPYCQCYQTFSGEGCNISEEPEQIDATNSQITLVSPWLEQWVGAYCTSGNFDLNYMPSDAPHSSLILSKKLWDNPPVDGSHVPLPTDRISKDLYEAIVTLHDKVGNADTKNKYIVINDGATEIISAIHYAATKTFNGEVGFSAPAPYWPKFPKIPPFIPKCKWYERHPDVEAITIPNNPDGDLDLKPLSTTKLVYRDLVYYWPSCVWNKPLDKRNDDIMVFSLSKFAGMAATRFGWCVVKDEYFANAMAEYITGTQLNLSVDIQKRALHTLTKINQHVGKPTDMMSFISKELKIRWKLLDELFASKKSWKIASKCHCSFVIWLESTDKDVDAYKKFLSIGVTGERGVEFGGDSHQIRLNIGQENPVFHKLLNRLHGL